MVRNTDISKRCSVSSSLDQRKESVLRWFGHMDKIDMTRYVKKSTSDFAGQRKGGRPRRWYDMVCECLREHQKRMDEA